MKVGIVEDHFLFLELLSKICVEECGHSVVATVTSGSAAVDALAAYRPELLLIDIGLPDIDGFEVLRRVRLFPRYLPRVIVISGVIKPYIVYQTARANVHGFIYKRSESIVGLRKAITEVSQKRTYFCPPFTDFQKLRREDPFSFDKVLTNREQLVLTAVSRLLTDDEIADMLSISRRTVETHRLSICHKLNLESRTQLIRYAHECGFPSVEAPHAR